MRPIRINEQVCFYIEPLEDMQVRITLTDHDRYQSEKIYEMDREQAQHIGLMLMWAAEKSLKDAHEALHGASDLLQELWDSFDTPFDEYAEVILEPFLWWPAGTDRYVIWHWFDRKHPKGLFYLMFGKE